MWGWDQGFHTAFDSANQRAFSTFKDRCKEKLTHLLKNPKQTNKTYGKNLMQCKYQTVGILKETEQLSKLLMAYNSVLA